MMARLILTGISLAATSFSLSGGRLTTECPTFVVESEPLRASRSDSTRALRSKTTETTEVGYTIALPNSGKLEAKVYLQRLPREGIERKWARFRVVGTHKPLLLSEIVLEGIDTGKLGLLKCVSNSQLTDKTERRGPWLQSYPAFFRGGFAGIEFPVASTRIENGKLLLAHKPGVVLQPKIWYESRRAVAGVAEPGAEVTKFKKYIASLRPAPTGMHFNYNSWWTSPVPYTEADILRLMGEFHRNLFLANKISFDSFCIDLGWSDPKSVWNISSQMFPKGFANIRDAARKMNCSLGLWVSPSNCYSPASVDNEWAHQNGYETLRATWDGGNKTRYLCLAGKRYSEALRKRMVEMTTKWGVRQFKFDGYLFDCPESDHGHQPGQLSAEAVANGLIEVLQGIRKSAPDTWIETTCMGWNPSPWWLSYANSVIGTYGDDAPRGRVPCPISRESATTARDYFNLQGAALLPIPAAAQEVLGIIHQTSEPFLNDAVTVVLRGNMFVPAYINPAFMNERRWRDLADLMKWSRANAGILSETVAILPKSWRGGRVPEFKDDEPAPREPYGYAHWKKLRGLIHLRNPWIEPVNYELTLDESIGVPKCLKDVTAVSLYPEPRCYGVGLSYGGRLRVPLAPYETVVLSVAKRQRTRGLPLASDAVGNKIRVALLECTCERQDYDDAQPAYGPDYTSLVGNATSGAKLAFRCSATIDAPNSELLVLLEDKSSPVEPICRIRVNGKDAHYSVCGSDNAWHSSGMPTKENWLFIRAPLSRGHNLIEADLIIAGLPTVSAWIWATKPGSESRPSSSNGLPCPELIYLDAAKVIDSTDLAELPAVARLARPVERIDGVFLDTIEPLSVTLGWGALQKNKSVWEKPINIAGRPFRRGLGTHAPSRIVYDLKGEFSRFVSWVGANSATAPSVEFEVVVDGVKRWESGLMTRDTPAKLVDVDISGAKTLELIVTDGGNGAVSDHADWADAQLIR